MADLRIGTATAPPNFSELKLGSENIQKVYSGSTLVWPIVDPSDETIPFTSFCNLDFTMENSTRTLLQDGSTIPIVTTGAQWNNYLYLNQPAAVWWQYNSSNSNRGLFYNRFAFDGNNPIQPPSGWRIPTKADYVTLITSPCNTSAPNQNVYGANTGLWDMTLLTNTTGLGDSGFNANGYGHVIYYTSTGNLGFIFEGTYSFFGIQLASNPTLYTFIFDVIQANNLSANFAGTTYQNSGYNLRFCR